MNTGLAVRMPSRTRQICAWVIGPLAIGFVCGALLGPEQESRADECPGDEVWFVGEKKADDPAEAMRWPASGTLSIGKLELDDENGGIVTLEFDSE
jgi:hypothetical protein